MINGKLRKTLVVIASIALFPVAISLFIGALVIKLIEFAGIDEKISTTLSQKQSNNIFSE